MSEDSSQSPQSSSGSGASADLHQLLVGLVEGKLADDQFVQLEAILADDPQARADYHRQLQVHTLLMYGHQHESESATVAEHRPLDSADEFAKYVYQASSQASWQSDMQRDAAFFCNSNQQANPPIPDLSPIPGIGEDLPAAARVFLPWITSGILGIALAAVVVVAWILPRRDDDGGSAVAGTQLPSVHILSGTTRLDLPMIGQIVIDGPAEFDMIGPMRARMSRGRVNVHVTKASGRGFVLETPYGNVTDLGTEFGIDLSKEGQAGLVVFDGEVDLRVPSNSVSDQPIVERLTQGDGVLFDKTGAVNPIGAIRRDGVKSFALCSDDVSTDKEDGPVIVNVTDNLREAGSRKFYEIVPGGFERGAYVYVDRFFTFKKLPDELSFLNGADYVKMFNDDRYYEDLKVSVTLARPAKLYVIFDSRLNVPDWLSSDFRQLPDVVWFAGSNTRTSTFRFTTGFSVWERIVKEPSTVDLGYCYATGGHKSPRVAMYSIAAVPLHSTDKAKVGLGTEELGQMAFGFTSETSVLFSASARIMQPTKSSFVSWSSFNN